MANTIKLKRSSVPGKAPLSANLDYGELSINYTDGTLYYKDSSGNINTIGSNIGNTVSSGNISATANVSGQYFVGNVVGTTVTTTGNVSAQYFVGDATYMTGIAPTIQQYFFANTASDVSPYYRLKAADDYTAGALATVSSTVSTSATLLASFLTEAAHPNTTVIPVGLVNFRYQTQKASGNKTYVTYAELWKRTTGGTETKIANSSPTISTSVNTLVQQATEALIGTAVSLNATDRLAVKIYAYVSSNTDSINFKFDSTTLSGFTLPLLPASSTNFVPYVNATSDLNLGTHSLTVGNIVPAANVAYDIGTPALRFRSLYLSGNTIDLGGASIKTDATTGAFAFIPQPTVANPNPVATIVSPSGTITVANTIGGNLSTISFSTASNASTSGGNVTIGNLTITNGIFWNNGSSYSSGSGGGFNANTTEIAIGYQAGTNTQGGQAVAIGESAGFTMQCARAIAIGVNAGRCSQNSDAVAVGNNAGKKCQGCYSVAVGHYAGRTSQGYSAIAIGTTAGNVSQGVGSIAIGTGAGGTSQGSQAVAIGGHAGCSGQSTSAVAIGACAAATSQGGSAVAIGAGAGNCSQGGSAVAVGNAAGNNQQGQYGIAVGYLSGHCAQGSGAVAIGRCAGFGCQQTNAVAIGYNAGQYSQGACAVAIGRNAGVTNQVTHSIVINASGNVLDPANSGFYVDPIRSATGANVVVYNTTTKELTYTTLPSSYTNTNVEAYIGANIGAYQTYANSAIQTLSANIGTLIAGAPGALDTLYEIDQALGNNASFSATMVTWLGNITTNVTTANTSISTLNANLGAYQIYANANIGTLFNGNTSTNANLGAFQTYANTKIGTNTNSNLVVVSTTPSTTATTGALVVGGGVGISGNVFTTGWIVPTSNVSQNIGSTTSWWNVFYGKSVQAQYADLAEIYTADHKYQAGTVVVFGGTAEVTTTSVSHDTRVAGVVSTEPAYLMNSVAEGIPVAMTGRVPCQVRGPVTKGTVLVTSDTPGVAEAIDYDLYRPGAVLGKSLGEIPDSTIQTIEVVVGRF